MSRVLVTGGAGFIGRAIVELLLSEGEEVRVFDDFSRGNKSNLENLAAKVELVSGDIRDFSAIKKAMHKIDSVFHLAYINGTESFYSKPNEVFDVAIKGIQNLCEIVNAQGLERFFLASSSEVYQEPDVFPTPEDVALVVPNIYNPRYSYGLGKIVQEFYTIHALKNVKYKTIFRPHNIYGPNMGFQHVIPELFLRMRSESTNTFLLKGDGSQSRSFCEIRDFISGLRLLLHNDVPCDIFNIGTTNEITIRELAYKISKLLNLDLEIHPGNKPLGETSRRLPDLSKIEQIGYYPAIDLDAGLATYYDWFESFENS
jgi:nucleoside-diphosphate-sugar epimerase